MTNPVLRPFRFFNAQTTAGDSPAYNIDVRLDNATLRSVSGTRADVDDIIKVLLETVFEDNDGNQTVVTATATIWTSADAGTNSCVIQGPFTRIKLKKVGASGAATFVGLV